MNDDWGGTDHDHGLENARQAAARADQEFRELALDTPRRSRVEHRAASVQADQEAARAAARAARLADLMHNDLTLTSWADFKAWRNELNQNEG